MVGKTGLEPATPSSQNWCSSQLNYFPILPVPNLSVLVHLQVDFPGSTPVIPLSATLHVLYLELMTSSYTYSYYLLRFPPQSCSNPLSSLREYWVTHDISLSALTSIRFHIVLWVLVLWTSALGDDTWTFLVRFLSPCDDSSILTYCPFLLVLFCVFVLRTGFEPVNLHRERVVS